MKLSTVRGSLARPTSGNALHQLALAEEALDAARALVLEAMDGNSILGDSLEVLALWLANLDMTLTPIAEVSSSDASEPLS